VSLLWIRVAGSDPGDEEGPEWYHVSPHQMRNGTILKPPGRGRGNFDQSSGEHTYLTRSRDRAEVYRYHLWELGFPKSHMYEVEPQGPVEPDPEDEESHRTKHPVKVTWHMDADDDDEGWNDKLCLLPRAPFPARRRSSR
jgi:hypothetical protein